MASNISELAKQMKEAEASRALVEALARKRMFDEVAQACSVPTATTKATATDNAHAHPEKNGS